MPAKSFALVLATAAVIAGSAQAETVVVDPPPSFTYEADTVRQIQVRNEWGRYGIYQQSCPPVMPCEATS